MKIIDGRKIADGILARLKKEIERRRINPCLAVILVGDNPSSVLYIKAKEKAAEKIGVRIKKFFLPANSSENEILEVIKKLNNNLEINGILVQMPLPKGISPDRIIKEISPEKDVDGLLPKSGFDSPFILSIWEALQATKENLENKKIIALVNSEIFGERMSMFFKKKGLNLKTEARSREADVLITALGQPGVIKGDMVKQGVILIDGGISRVDGRTAGDIDEESVKQKAKWLSPVPGGLGPLTVAFLLKNLI
ncbi:bifunctional 5,10-methylenetetrahydrofolate dehydrogenase/5,10-methenyltetrahydrofolate cyclohydrolase [Patescibacteria group bacterium]|nr:bifunctional 5,10-methylenetetrahydrofolate dehydrogenase/5,10-methenyltetrahydrofolate cyclohydrolase [Patescibacteria group bacterium]